MLAQERPDPPGCERAGYVVSAAIGAVIVCAVGLTAALVPACGLEASSSSVLFAIIFGFPITFVVALVGAGFGHASGKKTMVVEAILLALALLTIGVMQAVPHEDNSRTQVICRPDP
jgi:hypothetical protein